jgi:hypothetical protein
MTISAFLSNFSAAGFQPFSGLSISSILNPAAAAKRVSNETNAAPVSSVCVAIRISLIGRGVPAWRSLFFMESNICAVSSLKIILFKFIQRPNSNFYYIMITIKKSFSGTRNHAS